ncbi:unnamed protein product [Closterium sp. Yama58-4]|nr:unnamed protein product [Closterium sp. Yama58-4]
MLVTRIFCRASMLGPRGDVDGESDARGPREDTRCARIGEEDAVNVDTRAAASWRATAEVDDRAIGEWRNGKVENGFKPCLHEPLSPASRAAVSRISVTHRTLVADSRIATLFLLSLYATVEIISGSESEPGVLLSEPVAMPSPVEGSSGGASTSGGSDVPILSGLPKGVVIRDIEELQRKKRAMRAAGHDTVQVIADFDRTLTKFTVNGKPGQSCHMLLNLRHPELEERGRRLTAKYLPLETDPHLPYEEKFKCMVEWWTAAHELLLESGITRADVTQSVAAANTAFRDGFCDMLALLEAHVVPLLIFSAGLADVIEELLRQQLPRSFSNVRVVSNRMQFDESGRLVAFPGRIIHVLNKNEHALELAAMEEASAPSDTHTHGHATTTAAHTNPASATQVLTMPPQGVEEAGAITAAEEVAEVRSRTNVILLGDHLGDLGMSEGVSISNQISVGFLNHDLERQLEIYKSVLPATRIRRRRSAVEALHSALSIEPVSPAFAPQMGVDRAQAEPDTAAREKRPREAEGEGAEEKAEEGNGGGPRDWEVTGGDKAGADAGGQGNETAKEVKGDARGESTRGTEEKANLDGRAGVKNEDEGGKRDTEREPKRLKSEAGASEEAETTETAADGDKGDDEDVKRERNRKYYKKKKVALFIAYCGAGYQGMQRNPGARTIEGELEKALYRAGAILENDLGDFWKIDWMRSARTDKGVSALGQVVSVRLVLDPPGFVERVNKHLPKQVRLLGFVNVTAGFNAKDQCDRRRYEYVIPTFCFNPLAHRDREYLLRMGLIADPDGAPAAQGGGEGEGAVGEKGAEGKEQSGAAKDSAAAAEEKEKGKADGLAAADKPSEAAADTEETESKQANKAEGKAAADAEDKPKPATLPAPLPAVFTPPPYTFDSAALARLNHLLGLFVGTHCFHNYTVKVSAKDAAAKRYIVSFAAEGVTSIEGMECVKCVVVGQSFMLHQIRKMVGMVLAVMRGHAPEEMLTDAFRRDKRYNVPLAPELGLFLVECMFPAYNNKWAASHPLVTLEPFREAAERFKEDVVYPHIVSTERKTHVFATWLSNLNDRNYPDFVLARAEAKGLLGGGGDGEGEEGVGKAERGEGGAEEAKEGEKKEG